MRRRVGELEQLTGLAEAVAAADSLDELGSEVVERARDLLEAHSVWLYLLDVDDDRLVLSYASPDDGAAPRTLGLTEVGSGLARRSGTLTVSLVAGRELLGALVARGTTGLDLARVVANQTAVALKKIQVLERLTEKNIIRDFFDDLVAGRGEEMLRAKVARLGVDLSRPHVVLAADDADARFERKLAGVSGALVDRRERGVRALLPVPAAGVSALLAELRRLHAAAVPAATVGVSSPRTGIAEIGHGFEEARHALVGGSVMARTGSVVTYEELGAYKYLLRIAHEPGANDVTIAAVGKLARYDRDRNASLLPTLEEYLRRRGNISATSDALYVHPNTLRQRLRRIGDLTGLDLRRDDWLMIEIAVKLVRLDAALAAVTAAT
ncbi:MAG TPA: helix-turn-helix domain-containing protein [Gaiellaceae bacterium]